MTKRYAVDIDWETDGHDKKDLPNKVEIPEDVHEDDIADFLSDEYGWLINDFEVIEVV